MSKSRGEFNKILLKESRPCTVGGSAGMLQTWQQSRCYYSPADLAVIIALQKESAVAFRADLRSHEKTKRRRQLFEWKQHCVLQHKEISEESFHHPGAFIRAALASTAQKSSRFYRTAVSMSANTVLPRWLQLCLRLFLVLSCSCGEADFHVTSKQQVCSSLLNPNSNRTPLL